MDLVQRGRTKLNPNKDTQIIEFLDAVNKNLLQSLPPRNKVTLDKSMIKAYHRNLKGKIKIKRKPRPIGNEIKDMADARSNIAMKLELYETNLLEASHYLWNTH